jgi:hypothetical protein
VKLTGPASLQFFPHLPQALLARAHEAVVTKDGFALWASLPACRKPSPPGGAIFVPAGRATHVPQAAVSSGTQRTITVTTRASLAWVSRPRPGVGQEDETAWHARGQGACIPLAAVFSWQPLGSHRSFLPSQ